MEIVDTAWEHTSRQRSWGEIVGELAVREWSGQLAVACGDIRYRIAIERGRAVSAVASRPDGAALSMALDTGLVGESDLAELASRLAEGRDDIDVIAEYAGLRAESASVLRRQVILRRAARTFAPDRGAFSLDECAEAAAPTASVDLRAIVYVGARRHAVAETIATDLARLGDRFVLGAGPVADGFAFTGIEVPLIARLRGGATLEELERCDVDPRIVRATLYALVCCHACDAVRGRRRRRSSTVPLRAARTADASSPEHVVQRGVMSATTYFHTNPESLARRKLQEQLLTAIAAGADDRALLGVTPDAPMAEVRAAHAAILRVLRLGAGTRGEIAERIRSRLDEAVRALARSKEARFAIGTGVLPKMHGDE